MNKIHVEDYLRDDMIYNQYPVGRYEEPETELFDAKWMSISPSLKMLEGIHERNVYEQAVLKSEYFK